MKRLLRLIALGIILATAATASAVTQNEMDQARALAAKAYLRFANDGSGYLDEISPKSMADLEKHLKAKEKENIKAFKGIAVPSGYETWTKEQLVEFWGKAFSTKGLIEKGRAGRSRAKKYIGEMTVSAPAKAEPKAAEEKPEAKAEPKATPQETPEAREKVSEPSTAIDSAQATLEKAEAIVENGMDAIDADPQVAKVKDNSIVYIIILIVLVCAVIALVVFASNVMKKNASAARREAKDGDALPAVSADDSGKIAEMREKFAATLTAKNNEIANLTKKIEMLTSQNVTLKRSSQALNEENTGLKSRLASATAALESIRKASGSVSPAQAQTERTKQPGATATEAASAQAKPASAPLRTIYLGRVNSKGIFIRADRNLSAGNSVYQLDTTDGFSGTFRVASDPTVWEMALLTPRESLAGGCVCADIDGTSGMEKIVTEAAGTAIFENGCWRVLRKAKIRYE